MKSILLVFLSLFFVLSCTKDSAFDTEPLFQSHELPFSNNLTNTTQLNILNYLYFYNGAGTAIGDFTNDGLLDIYLVSNLEQDQLLINEGELRFRESNLLQNDKNSFTTGITTVDINHDGLLDIYLSQVSGHLHLESKNKLYINQGIENGNPIFKEEAQSYGLDLSGLFTQATFFDYDLDGDLDAYLLKHSVHPNSNYARASIRNQRDSVHGDMLLENRNGQYVDVSAKAGIIQTKISYGLGISTGDLNNDGYPDIYIGNDFFENDYLYINQQDGTFQEVNASENRLGHTTHFSMGNEIADINNDGLADILSVDMLPEDLETLKAAGTEYAYPIYQNQLRAGYQPQYMQNTLHINQGNNRFAETAFQSGIAATEWSWSPLVVDFDLDGNKDIFITNGIAGATNDMDFVNFISNDEIQKRLGKGMLEEDLALISQLPEKKTSNYFFKNQSDTQFTDITKEWFKKTPSLSNGAAYGDLDNDGDLDLVINNVNENAQILENKTVQKDSSTYLKIRFRESEKNTQAIGAKIITYYKNKKQTFENYTTRGYFSSVAPEITIGLGKGKILDSVIVIWPGGKFQTLENLSTNQTLEVDFINAKGNYYNNATALEHQFLANVSLPFEFAHKDGISLEFSRDILVPFSTTNQGPYITSGDLNSDQLDDIVLLGGKGQLTEIALQQPDGTFLKTTLPLSKAHSIHEDVHAIIFDANGDEKNDLLVLSGGNEFKSGKALQPRLYLQENNNLRFIENALPVTLNASKAQAVDLDNDGDLDLSISANVTPHEFGKTPQQYLFENDGKGNYRDISSTYASTLQNMGNVYDISWQDIDGNGYPDAIVAGHWMPITILLNNGTSLKLQENNLGKTNGWWNTIEVADFDKDGDLDIMAGNWGLNTRLKASEEEPVKLYRNDFDDNGKIDPIITYFFKGEETTIATKDELVKQLPFINKEFLSYNAFAKADLSQLFPSQKLKSAETKYTYELASMYFENTSPGVYKAHRLPFNAQSSCIMDIRIDDFNNDNYLDVLLVGNNYEISTQLGRLDASNGTLLLNDCKGYFTVSNEQNFNISGPARSVSKLDINSKTHYIVGLNNATPVLLKKVEE